MADNTELDQSGNQSLIDMAKANAKKLKDNILGTEAQNKAAAERQDVAAKKYPDSAEARVKKMSGGGRTSASKRADGCAIRGKTRA